MFNCRFRTVVSYVVGTVSLVGFSAMAQETNGWKPPVSISSQHEALRQIDRLSYLAYIYAPYPKSKYAIEDTCGYVAGILQEVESRLSGENDPTARMYFGSLQQDLHHGLALSYYRIYLLDKEYGSVADADEAREEAITHLKSCGRPLSEADLEAFVTQHRRQQTLTCCELCSELQAETQALAKPGASPE